MYKRSVVHAAYHPTSTVVSNVEEDKGVVGKVVLLEKFLSSLQPHLVL